MDAATPTGRLRAWLREALGVMRDAVAEAPVAEPPRLAASASAAPELREAFSARALVGDGGLVGGWEGICAELEAAVDAYVAGEPVTIAVVGEAGSGREVLLDHVERRIRRAEREVPTARIEAQRGELRQLLEAELAPGGKQALLVGNAHRAYHRRIGGFADLRASLDLLSDTRERALWVVEFDAVPWAYLDRVYQVATHFSHVIQVPPLDAEDLHRAVQRRLVALAGSARLEFAIPADLPLEEHGDWARAGYAARLHLASRGNPEAAGELILRRLVPAGEGAFQVQAPPPLALTDLGELPPQQMVALELLLSHEALTPAGLAELLVLAPSEARSLLDGLAARGLVRGDRHAGYAVDPVWRAPLIDLLQSKNLL